MKVCVSIPAYNEEQTIGTVIKEIPRQIEGIDSVQIIVMDDGSTDDTIAKALESGADHIVRHTVNKGLGVTFKDSVETALRNNADYFVNIDADGQYDPKQIPDLLIPLQEGKADIVIGWRDIDKLPFMPLEKKIGNKIATWVTRRLSGLPIIDAQTGFRAFTREAILRLALQGKYTYVQETLIQAAHNKLQVVQMPIEFRERKGESRLIRNIWSYAFRTSSVLINTYVEYHPFKFFGIIGGILEILGLSFGIGVFAYFARTGHVSPHESNAIVASLLIVVGAGVIGIAILFHLLTAQRRTVEEILYRVKKNEFNKDPLHNP